MDWIPLPIGTAKDEFHSFRTNFARSKDDYLQAVVNNIKNTVAVILSDPIARQKTKRSRAQWHPE
jgi:hypothetical protein